MGESGLVTFVTRVGTCALGWGPVGLVAVLLPDSGGGSPLARLRQRFPDVEAKSPPDWVTRSIESITAHLTGGRIDLSEIRLDFSRVGSFEASVYREARSILPGETVTYGELASRMGDRNLARAVGQALGRNPWPIVVPCHRVTAADGRTGGFSAPGGASTKLRLLELEGALAAESLPLFASGPRVSAKPAR